ncbi:MAG: hypothetical protein ACI3XL_02225 [Eubacteriales bacterium]
MKRFASFILIFVLVCAMVGTVSASVFAEEATPGAAVSEGSGLIDTLLAKVRGFVTAEKLAELKTLLFSLPAKMLNFIKSAFTLESLPMLLAGVAAVIFVPIVFGLVVIAFVTIGAMIVFAGALTAIVEVLLTILSGLIAL